MKKKFDQLISKIEQRRSKTLAHRVATNPHPNITEYQLGTFIEMLEPQVRQAVLELHKKGYSTDVSGFMDTPGKQIIEGDFLLDDATVKRLRQVGVLVEVTSSSYTKLHFSITDANIPKIKRRWDTVVSLIPDKRQVATPSMTRKARDFRLKNR